MKELEQEIRTYLEERHWNNLRPGDLAKSIMIEGAELMEIFQWQNPEVDEVKSNPEKLEKIKKELADVMLYCFDLAVTLDLDVETIIRAKLQVIREKFPAELFTGREVPGTEEAYLRIKEEYRREGKN